MNANIAGLLAFCKKRNIGGLIVTADGYALSDTEARAYLRWCSINGYNDLYSAPDYNEVKDKLTK